MTKLTYNEKYELYKRILSKYALDSFDERINNNDYLVCVNIEFYSDFENIEKSVFDCITELNSHTLEFDDFFVCYKININDTLNECIIITSARKMSFELVTEHLTDELLKNVL